MFEPWPQVQEISFSALERDLLDFWKREGVFRRSVESGAGKPRFTFYEGPPTANGIPHWGHVLTRVAKDVFLRFKTMDGFFVPRHSGWDTHGLPVEIEVEKELGIHGKAAIEELGVEAFTRRCMESVFRYIGEWERMSDRIGFWLDAEGYATFHRSYVESVWWALSELFKQGLLYQGHKIVWWWPQGGTALSAGEVGEGYRTVNDPSVIVRFRLARRPEVSILAWTTTPWTLPSNVALAVAPDEVYVEVEGPDKEHFIVAKALVEKVFAGRETTVLRTFPGSALEGSAYQPLFDFREPETGKHHEVTCADFVTLDTGTGIVHMAPAFGEDDFKAAKEKGFGFLCLIRPDGTFDEDCGPFAGLFCKDADKELLRDLDRRGLLFSRSTFRHEYPFCPRADRDPLIQYARRSWFIKTSTEKERVLANNAKVRWQPNHIRDGRMGDFLRNNVDWAISRERWWGTPLPIWVNDETGRMEAVASVEEILARNPDAFREFERAREKDPSLSEHLMVHKPFIDAVTWTKEGEPGVYRRVPEVIDCWFDSGSMPFAQWGYPHRNRDRFEEAFPADFITEAVDQTRGWWNALLQISTLLFPDAPEPHPFKSCVVLGHITDKEGRKLSKRLMNYDPPMEAIEESGADAVRWALLSAGAPGLNIRFHKGVAKQSTRDLLLKVWNVASFLVTYARIDGWDPGAPRPDLANRPLLDRWILAELEATTRDVRAAFDDLDSQHAAKRLQAFVDGLSNWYIRRSRPRFWAEGDLPDKQAAFATLFEALGALARLLAPFTPFLADALYQRLERAPGGDGPISVHLTDYPEPDPERANPSLCASMALVREVVALGLRVRAVHRIRVRQPLFEAILLHAGDAGVFDRFSGMVREELNVKALRTSDRPHDYVEFEVVPNFRALGPRLGKRMPLLKQALKRADGEALFDELERTGKLTCDLGGQEGRVELARDEVEVRLKGKEGFAAAGEGGYVVVLDTRISDDLRREGLAREVVNRIQTARKTLDLPYEARIEIVYEAKGDLAEAIEAHADSIRKETLALRLEPGDPGGQGTCHESEILGAPLRFGLRVAAGRD